MKIPARAALLGAFGFLAVAAAWQELWPPRFSARLEVATDPLMPARVYLFKNNAPFRIAPVDAVIPILSDTFYRDRLWKAKADPAVLEVVAADQYHTLLLKGRASFDLPPGRYRMEAYRGTFYTPASIEFELKPEETRKLTLPMKAWARPEDWISADAHIHLTRSRGEDGVFLDWLAAEDLGIGHFLQLQRQVDAAPQYAFGRAGEARRGRHIIRPGQETRNQVFGHVLMLGVNELIRPLAIGAELSNSADNYPYLSLLLDRGRQAGGAVGYAHFRPGNDRVTLLMDLALGKLDFVEAFQFGAMTEEPWYELLNAGFRIPAISGTDFPVPFGRFRPWPRWLPLLGSERTLVRARPGGDDYQAWTDGVRAGEAVVTNGPLVEVAVNGGEARATASFHRPLEVLEIVENGHVTGFVRGDGKQTWLSVRAPMGADASSWVAARTRARRLEGEPEIRAHTNPRYVLRGGRPVHVPAARRAVAAKWEAELSRYRAMSLEFGTDGQRREFFDAADKALRALSASP
jgi:hypothetical protein